MKRYWIIITCMQAITIHAMGSEIAQTAQEAVSLNKLEQCYEDYTYNSH